MAAFVPFCWPAAFPVTLESFVPLACHSSFPVVFSPFLESLPRHSLCKPFHPAFKAGHLAFGPFSVLRNFRIWVLSASDRAIIMIAAEMQTVVPYVSA